MAHKKFNLPLDLSRLENEKLKLVPIEENLEEWLELWVKDYNTNLRNYDYLVDGPFKDGAEAVESHNKDVRDNEQVMLFAIVLKAGPVSRKDPVTGEVTTLEVADGTFAGISGLSGEPERATAELGALLCTPYFRTFVGTNANALLLHHLLDSPKEGGLGLRRVQWMCNAENAGSMRMAQRMGFKLEGIIRFQQILPLNKVGSKGAEIDKPGLPKVGWDGREWGPGRHTAMLSLCWDDWQNGGRDHVIALVKR